MQPKFNPIIIDAPQRSEKWFEARLGIGSASKANEMLAMDNRSITKGALSNADTWYINNPHVRDAEWREVMRDKYPAEYCLQAGVEIRESAARKTYREEVVSERFTKLQKDIPTTRAMQWGVISEPFARAHYENQYNMHVDNAPLFLHPKLMCGATPDGLVTDKATGEVGNLEIKCLESHNHLFKAIKAGIMPAEHNAQVQMQMWLTTRDWCDFVAYDSRFGDTAPELMVFKQRIERDDFYIDNVLVPGVIRFLDECDAAERQIWAIIYSKREKAKQNVA